MVLRLFAAVQKAYPSLASLGTGAVMMGAGDAAVQHLCNGSLDPRRSMVCSAYSGMVSPGIYHWWKALDARWPGVALRSVCRKVLVNQAVLGPLNCALFLGWSHCAQALIRSCAAADLATAASDFATAASEAVDRIQAEVPDLATKAMCVWIPVHTITFRFVPAPYRILYTSSISVLWGGYLSYVANGDGCSAQRDTRGHIECIASVQTETQSGQSGA
mmetsp:Transcript_83720/g.240636  ORF Transcript_83720/g.240636 Transcript_83720/m.240636 type:complete len:218 (+) Transcript_83720:72-725(+)